MGEVPQKSLWWKWQVPRHGLFNLTAPYSLVSNVVLAAYQGSSLQTLQLFGKGTNRLSFAVTAGQTFYFAAAVAAEAIGDVAASGGAASPFIMTLPVPGNLLLEPSWEGTALNTQHWGQSANVGGYVNESGGCDGSTWPVLGTGAEIWQDFPSVPGHDYLIRFAHFIGLSGCCGQAGVRTLWDNNDLGITYIPEEEEGFWHSGEFIARASNTTTRLTFQNVYRNLEMDAFSVIDASAPPVIVTQPESSSTLLGGSAAFIVGVIGSAALHYQWFHNGSALPDQTQHTLLLDPVTEADVGTYRVHITNRFGVVTSREATLAVDAPTNATIIVQPYGDTVPAGIFHTFTVAAAGTPPFTYQWVHNGLPVLDATNRSLVLTNVLPAHAGIYEVEVQNQSSKVRSLPVTLMVTTGAPGGGKINFRNHFSSGPDISAPVFDIDGVTRLNGDAYSAQLYAGPTVSSMRPTGELSPFLSGFLEGYFTPKVVTLPTLGPGQLAFTQVRVWDRNRGATYEEARAQEGRFGRSAILQVIAGGIEAPPNLGGLTSFSLQVGLPLFNVGTIELESRQPGGAIVWALTGEPGFRYLVEKSSSPDPMWRPFVVLTNTTGRVTFPDSADSGSKAIFYRSRILD